METTLPNEWAGVREQYRQGLLIQCGTKDPINWPKARLRWSDRLRMWLRPATWAYLHPDKAELRRLIQPANR